MREHLWVYGVVGSEAPVPAQLGVDPNHRVQLVRAAGLAALASHVGCDEYVLRAALQDRAVFAALAHVHARVLDAALARGPVVPFRVGAVFADEAGVRELLAQAQAGLMTALRRLRGRAEWGVKVYALHEATAPVSMASVTDADHHTLVHAVRTSEAVERLLLVIHARLTDHASDVMVTPASEGTPPRTDANLVLDARYLVVDTHAGAFGAEAAELAREAGDQGMQLELTGPFPAYHFSALVA